MRQGYIVLLLGFLYTFQPVHAQKAEPSSPYLDALAKCRVISETNERAQCYDQGYDAFIAAYDRKEVVVVDRETVREARKGLFGFSLPSLRLFGGGEADDEITQIDSTVESAHRGRNGEWVIAVANGSRWRQIDDKFLMQPKQGQSINIRKGTFGAYVARVNDRNGVKVVREN